MESNVAGKVIDDVWHTPVITVVGMRAAGQSETELRRICSFSLAHGSR